MDNITKRISENTHLFIAGDIAVIGMACRFPGADNYNAYWENICKGINSIREIPADRWDVHTYYSTDMEQPNKTISKWCGVVEGVDQFDNRFFGISPKEANFMDPQQRLLLEETLHCIEDSGIPLQVLQNRTTSVFIGVMAVDYNQESAKPGIEVENYAGTGSYECILANRISYYFGLKGKSYSIDAACASSFVALHEAKRSLLTGECDFAIVGGVNLNLRPWKYITWSKLGVLSPEGQCKAFDRDANGYVPGDGVGILLLQRKNEALNSNNKIYGVIKGSAVNHSGKGKSLTTPCVAAQKDVIISAYKDAGINPDAVTYVEAQGTGSALADPIEIEALTEVFGEYTQEKQYCKIGSVKTNIGHLEAAAGIAGIIKVLLMMKHEEIPKHLNVNALHPMINWDDSPFQLATEHTKWNAKEAGLPLRSGISAFGAAGVNSHVILESFSKEKEDTSAKKEEESLFLFSAKSENSFKKLAQKWRAISKSSLLDEYTIQDICRTLANTKGSYRYRFGTAVKNKEELIRLLPDIPLNVAKSDDELVTLCVGDIAWQNFAEVRTAYNDVGLFKAAVDELFLSLKKEEGLQNIKRGFFNRSWAKNLQPVYSFIVTYSFLKALFQIGFKPQLVCGQKQGFLVLMALCKVIEVRDALYILTDSPKVKEIQWKRPSMPFWDDINSKIITPFEFSQDYLNLLIGNTDVDRKSANLYIEKGRILSATNLGFKKYIKEWQDVLAARGICIDELLFDDSLIMQENVQGKAFLLLIIVLSCLKKLNRKWDLREKEYLNDKRVYELADLIVDEVLDRETIIQLIMDDVHDYSSILNAMNSNQGNITESCPYKILKQYNQTLDISLSWIKEAVEYNNAAIIHDKEILQIGKVNRNEKDNISIHIPDSSSLKELFNQTVLLLWQGGTDIQWDILYPIHSYQKVSLPEYPFDHRRFWVKSPSLDLGHTTSCVNEKISDFTTQSMNIGIVEKEKRGEECLSKTVGDCKKNKMERVLKQVQEWLVQEISDLLEVPIEDIDRNEYISDYGFDSIVYMKFALRINNRCQSDISPAVFFRYNTVRSLAEYLSSEYHDALNTFVETSVEKECDSEKNEAAEHESISACSNLHLENNNGDKIVNEEEPIAIVGMSGRFPQAEELTEYWEILMNQKNAICEIPKERWDWKACFGNPKTESGKTNIKWGGFVKDIDKFDAAFFGISPREAELMDPQQRMFLETVWKTIEDAGYSHSELWGSNTGVFVGAATSDYKEILDAEKTAIEAHTSTGLFHSVLANRISYYFNFLGPSEPIDTACSSSLVAVYRAVEALRNGSCEFAIAGGVNALLTPTLYISFSKAGMLSADGRCRTFDESANGYVRGEGCGAVLLRPLRKAIENNDHIYGIIRGCSINHGGHANSLTAPNSEAQAKVLTAAYRQAGISPDRVGYIETHGTGTKLGDPIEIQSLKSAFEELYHDEGIPFGETKHCILGAVKSNIGHLEAAAGMAGLLKVLLCLKHKRIPPNNNFNTLNSFIKLAGSPFVIDNKSCDWIAKKDDTGVEYPRVAGVSSFGIGGVNAHIVIEEYSPPKQTQSVCSDPFYMIVLTAKTESSLKKYAETLAKWIEAEGEEYSLGDIAYTLLLRKSHFHIRCALVVGSKKELREKLQSIGKGDEVEGCLYGSFKKHSSKEECLQKEFGSHVIRDLKAKTPLSAEEYKENIFTLCQLFVKGDDLDWCELYHNNDCHCISMPSYVFERVHYWVETSRDTLLEVQLGRFKDALHPLIDRNESTLEVQSFSKAFDEKAFFIKENTEGKKRVPEAIQLVMAMTAGAFSNPKAKVGKVKNVVWGNPVIVSSSLTAVKINMYPRQDGMDYLVVSGDESNGSIIHSRGSLIYGDLPMESERLDIENIKERCKRVKGSKDSNVSFLSEMHFGALHYNDREVLSLLTMSPEHKKEVSECFLFPGLIDGILQAVFEADEEGKAEYSLSSLGEMDIVHAIPESCYVYARFNNIENLEKETAFAIDIADESGQILIRLRDLKIKRQQYAVNAQLVSTMHFKSEWVKSALSIDTNSKSKQTLKDIIVFDRGGTLYHQLKEEAARELGQEIRVVLVKPGEATRCLAADVYEVEPNGEAGYKELIKLLVQNQIAFDHMIHFWVNDEDFGDFDTDMEELNYSLYSLFYFSKAVMQEKLHSPIQITYVYSMTDDSIHPVHGGVMGFLQSLSLENTYFSCKTIGVPFNDCPANSERVWKEIIESEIGTNNICYLQKERYVKVLKNFNLKDEKGEKAEIRSHGVYLITGGAGGLGLIFARFLIKEYQARLVLTGRSELSADKLRELESLGGEVLYVKNNIAKKEDVSHLLETIHSKFGPLNGIIHSAGIIRPAYIVNKSKEEMEQIISPKALGVFLLDEVTKDENLDFMVLFSSIVAPLGYVGQSDYAFANGYMDYFSLHRDRLRNAGKRFGKTVAINWPIWKEGGMQVDEREKVLFAKNLGVKLLDTDRGVQAFTQGLAFSNCPFVVVEGDRDTLSVLTNNPEKTGFSTHDSVEAVSEKALIEFQQWLKREIAEVLKLSLADIHIEDDIRDYGLDSVLLTELTNRINTKYNLTILPPVFFEHSSVKSFSEYLCTEKASVFAKLYHEDNIPLEEAFVRENTRCFDEILKLQDTGKSGRFAHLEGLPKSSFPKDDVKEDIAVIGMSAVLPQSSNLLEFWNHLTCKKDVISEIPKDRWDWKQFYGEPSEEVGKTNIKWGGFMKKVDTFDASFFGISPREAEMMDPQHRIFLQVVWKTIEDAGYKMSDLWGSKTGLFAGVSTSDYGEIMREKGIEVEAHTSTGLCHSMLVNRISYLFNFQGPSEPVDTACSSSLVAVHKAVEAIKSGACDQAIAGGVNVLLSPAFYVSLSKAGMLSSDGKCKTFDKRANGYVRGEGCGAVLLKPLSKAIADGDYIYGVIKASSVKHQGRSHSLTAPNPISQAELLVNAYKEAGVLPTRVGYIETHGTGTSLGDPIEVNALKKAFTDLYEYHGLQLERKSYCALGAVKTNIGHLESASGIAGLLKVLLALRYKKIPGSATFKEQNPFIELQDTPFYIAKELEEWKPFKCSDGSELPRVAGVSSFGFGGVNAHIVVQEYMAAERIAYEEDALQVILLSAKTEERLQVYAAHMLKFVKEINTIPQSVFLRQIAYTLQVGREAMEERVAFSVRSIEDLQEKLQQYCAGKSNIDGVAVGRIRDDKENIGLLIDGEEGREYIELLIKNKRLLKLIHLWVAGINIDWGLLYREVPSKVAALPTYPFEEQRHWFVSRRCNDVSADKKNEWVKADTLARGDMTQELYSINDSKGVTMREDESNNIKKLKLKKTGYVNYDVLEETQEPIQEKTADFVVRKPVGSTVEIVKKIKELLAKTIYVNENKINENSCFTDLGLDSILSVEFIKKINKELKIDLKTVKIYDYPCINALAEYLSTIVPEDNKLNNNKIQDRDIAEIAIATRQVAAGNEAVPVFEESLKKNHDSSQKKNSDIAIIGMAGKFPGANDVEQYWHNLKNGISSITEIPSDRWDINEFYDTNPSKPDKTYCKWGGFLSDIDQFDPLFFNMSPTEAEVMDPQQRLFLEQAWHALEDAGYSDKLLNNLKCGVYAGVINNDYSELLAKNASLMNQAYAMTGNSNSMLASRIAYCLNLKGPAVQIDTACSSSLVAVNLASQSLMNGDADMMLAGGVTLYLTENSYIKMSNAGMLSQEGKCRTFDKKADGFVPGEGVGVVVLKLLENAIRDHDHIYGVIKGSGINQDGKTNGITAPSAESQKALAVEVYKKFNIHPESISYVEAHGTGTKLGDPIEIQALTDAFQTYTDKLQFCGIGSVKTNIGHTSAAAGVASLIKVLLSFRYKQLPPSLNFDEENEHIGFQDTPFYVNSKVKEWISGLPRRAAVSAFGFSGTNAHMILEEYSDSQKLKGNTEQKRHIIPISARNNEQLRIYAENVLNFIEKNREVSLGNVAYTFQLGRTAFEKRVAIVASSILELQEKLTSYCKEGNSAVDLPDVYCTGTNNSNTSLDKNSRHEYMAVAIQENNLAQLARLWAAGADVDWIRYYASYQTYSGQRISLPVYPFARQRCWVNNVISKLPEANQEVHPLLAELDPKLSLSEGGIAFCSKLCGEHQLISDHQVYNKPLLPGMGYLEMALAAGSKVANGIIGEIRNITWIHPLWIAKGNYDVHTVIKKQGELYDFQIQSQNQPKGPVTIHAKGELLLVAVHDQPVLQRVLIEEVKARCSSYIGSDELYCLCASKGILYGKYFRMVQDIYIGRDEVLGRIVLAQEYKKELSQYTLHPALMDSALQCIAGFKEGGGATQAKLPFSIGKIEVFRPLSERIYSHIKKMDKGQTCFNVDILDEDGIVCVRLSNIVLRMLPDQIDKFFYLPKWVYRPVSTQAIEPECRQDSGTVLIIHPPQTMGFESALVEECLYQCSRVILIKLGTKTQIEGDKWEVDTSSLTDFDTCIGKVKDIKSIYFLGGMDVGADNSWIKNLKVLEESQERGVIAFFRLVKALNKYGFGDHCIRVNVITNKAYKIVENEEIKPYGASLIGFARALAGEFYHWRVNCLDLSLEIENQDWKRLVKCINSEPAARMSLEVAIRNGKRYERVLEAAKLPPVGLTKKNFKHNGVYLVVGGAGGIGLEFSQYLSSSFAARLILVGRSELDERRKLKIDLIESLGGEVEYIQADLTNLESMKNVVKKAKERFGHIDGVVHSAIVLNDKTINNMDESILMEVLAPKVKGSVILANVLQEEPLDFMMFFSSAESFLCQAGQSNYAAASNFIDAFAYYLQDCQPYPIKIINWGYWGSVGVVANETYNHELAKIGIRSIEPKEGMEAIERILAQGCRISQVAVIKGEEDALQYLNFNKANYSEFFGEKIPSIIHELSLNLQTEDCTNISQNQEAFEKIDEWCDHALLQVFQRMGVFLHNGERYEYSSLKRSLGITGQYSRLYDVLLEILDKAGFIVLGQGSDNRTIVTSLLLDSGDTNAKLKALQERKKQLIVAFPYLEPHFTLVSACLRNYPEVITGRKHHMEVMFPQGSLALVEGIYSGCPIANYFNLMVANVVSQYVQKRLEHDPNAIITVLEIGAGTGGTSRFVLEAVKKYSGNVRFIYTDISPRFIQHGENAYEKDYPFIEFRIFDTEKPIKVQGFEADSIDLVFSTNVIHATQQVCGTLENVKRLLKAKGLIIVNEVTQRRSFIDIVFGLTDGWWRFSDEENRLPYSPLLNAALWNQVMNDNGIKNVRTVGLPDTEAADSTQCVLIGEGDGETRNEVLESAKFSAVKENFIKVVRLEPNISQSLEEDLRDKIVEYIKEVFSEVLKINISQIETTSTFERYGVDSLISLKLIEKFEDDFKGLPSTLLFEYMTVEKLAGYFISQHHDQVTKMLGVNVKQETSYEIKPIDDKSWNIPQDEAAASLGNMNWNQIDTDIQGVVDKKDPLRNVANETEDDIAIIGISGKYPEAETLDEFWGNLKSGKNCIREIPKDRWNWGDYKDTIRSKWGGFLKNVDRFDPLFFQITPDDAGKMDPQIRLFLETAWNAFEDAGYTSEAFDKIERQVGVFVGIMNSDYEFLSGENYGKGNKTGAHSSFWSVANRVSYRFDFCGPSLAVDTACSSSLTALHLACESLKRGECQMAIAGGVNLILHPIHYQRLSDMNMITSESKCKSFGEGADGFVDGEGVGGVVLKPLKRAIADKDHIYAVVKGTAINACGKTSGFTVPNPGAQSQAIAKALQKSGVHPSTISYIEAHGTGTELGDPIEIAGLTRAYANTANAAQYCAVGSVKSNIGHLESAAGIAGLTKIVLQMKYKQLVPTLNSEKMNPKIDFNNTPFYLQRELQEWQQPVMVENGTSVQYPRRAGLSSFGAGGANAHIIVEEYILSDDEQKMHSEFAFPQLFVLSANNKDRLKVYAQKTLDFLKTKKNLEENDLSLINIVYTLQVGREAMKERLAIAANSIDELIDKLSLYCNGEDYIRGVYTGNVKKAQKELELLLEGKDGAEILKYIVNSRNITKVAQLWVAGANMKWELLYNELPMRISLPTYPLLQDRYWIRQEEVLKTEIVGLSKPVIAAECQRLIVNDADEMQRKEGNWVGLEEEDKVLTSENKIIRTLSTIMKTGEECINAASEINLEYFDSMELVKRLCEDFGKHLNPMEIIACKTVADLINYVVNAGANLPENTLKIASLPDNEMNSENTKDKILHEVIAIVAKILKTDETEIDVDTDISEYGLDSINVMFLHYKFKEAFGSEIEPMAIVSSRTIRAMVNYLVDNHLIDDYIRNK
jgi:acyl transferase domain-containing protein/ubiquinone/menaquinone biosynthesis C-methylase UbiE